MEKHYRHLLISAALACGGFGLLLLSGRFDIYADVLMLVFFAGAVGAVVNNYFRVSRLVENDQALEAATHSRMVMIQMYVSLVIGGTLALAAYGLFAGGLLQGSLFPVFKKLDVEYVGVTKFLLELGPSTHRDAALALFWGFVAGYSERFVPNVIDSLVKKDAPETRV